MKSGAFLGIVRGMSERIVFRRNPGVDLRFDQIARYKTNQPTRSYLEIACNVGVSRRHMVGRARTTAGQTGISGADIREMPIPLAPVDEQQRIVAEIEERLTVVEKCNSQIEADQQRATRLRQSILKRAFEGKLVPQDPTDEPASVLLERIKTSAADPDRIKVGRKSVTTKRRRSAATKKTET